MNKKEITFTEDLNLIEGSNYSGKTSIIQAIYFGLFNEMLYKSLTALELKKEGQKDATVELDISIDGVEYRIRRNISGDKRIQVDSHLYSLIDGQESQELESVSRKGENLEKLRELMKSSKDYMKNINFILEDSIQRFIIQPKYKIEEDLNSILQLDYFGTIEEYCVQAIKELDNTSKSLEKQLTEFKSYYDKKNETLKSNEQSIKELLDKKKEIIEKVSQSQEMIKELSQLEKEGDDLDILIEKTNKQYEETSIKLEELQSNLEQLTEKEKIFEQLKKQEENFNNNKIKIQKLQKEKEQTQKELTSITKNELLIDDREKKLVKLQNEKKILADRLRSSEQLKKDFENIKKEREDYIKFSDQLESLNSQIKISEEILENFKKGDCPISHDKCPVAGELIEKRSTILKRLKKEKKDLQNQLTALENPEKKYKDLKDKIGLIEKNTEYINSIESKILNCTSEIEDLKKNYALKSSLEKKIKELSRDIKNCGETSLILEEKHDEYTRVKERLKDKEKIIKNIEKIKGEHRKTKDKKSKLDKEREIMKEKIEKFKENNDIIESEKEQEINTKQDELPSIEIEIGKVANVIEGIKKEYAKILNPYDSESELVDVLNQTIHERYRIIFFQESLNLTLKELSNIKLQEIKEKCNQIWAQFKSSTGMDSISWNKNFIPLININGFERNIYQLSASEKSLVYFSIRAALLAKLGPNYFIVVDNLLSPFMRENQKVVLSLLNDIINESKIQQIIFTGYDIDSEFNCKNIIKI